MTIDDFKKWMADVTNDILDNARSTFPVQPSESQETAWLRRELNIEREARRTENDQNNRIIDEAARLIDQSLPWVARFARVQADICGANNATTKSMETWGKNANNWLEQNLLEDGECEDVDPPDPCPDDDWDDCEDDPKDPLRLPKK